MQLNRDLKNYIDNILSKYFNGEEKVKAFSACYIAVITALANNPNVSNYWAYVNTVVMNTLSPMLEELVEQAYLKEKE